VLLDRKRINKWSKRVALAMAIVFGLSFVLLGVGSGTGVNWSDLWNNLSGGTANSATSGTPAARIKAYQAQLVTDPNNYDALVGIATQYQLLQQLKQAATYYERAIVVKPTVVDPYNKLAVIYLDPSVADNASAIRVLNQLTTLDPSNAQAFLQLGIAQRNAGNNNAAILAWSKYISLDPTSDMAKTVQTQIDQIKAAAATTTTTAGGATGTTAAAGATPTTLPATTTSS
jgi:cytochrome c-type biogenesis protein CcmH/NrfG